MHLRALLVLTVPAVLACGPSSSSVSPDGTLHLEDLGHSGSFGRSSDVAPRSGADATTSKTGGGRFASEIAALRSTIDKRWAHRRVHVEEEGIDIDAVFAALRTESASAPDGEGFRGSVSRALCRLGDGQLSLGRGSGKARPHSESGLTFRSVGETLLVESASDGYSGVGPGDLVLSVDGMPTQDWIRSRCIRGGSTPAQRVARRAESLERAPARGHKRSRAKKITLRTARSGKNRTVELRWRRPDTAECVGGAKLASSVGVVTVHSLECGGDTEAFRGALGEALAAAGSDHVLLDLRRPMADETGATAEAHAQMVAQSFAPAATVWTTVLGTDGEFQHQPFNAEPGVTLQAKKQWILTSARCAGACEMLAAVLSEAGSTVVGQATAGSMARPEPVAVTSGLQISMPTQALALPGTMVLVEGQGVRPTLEVTATIDVLAKGRDPEVMAVGRRIAGLE